MDQIIRDAQLKVLNAFAGAAKAFALSGGTALELFYLKHRFSRDLDFFSPKYNLKEIDRLAATFGTALNTNIKFENEFIAPNRAKVRFYAMKIKGTNLLLKIDFVEDVLFERPIIRKFDNIPVYDVKNIYLKKITTLTGTRLMEDETGREMPTGRREARDVIDIYYLSKKIVPLHKFIKSIDRKYQRGIVQWYRSYSRQEVKLGVLDLDIYDKKFDVSEMISYLDAELNKFMGEVLE